MGASGFLVLVRNICSGNYAQLVFAQYFLKNTFQDSRTGERADVSADVRRLSAGGEVETVGAWTTRGGLMWRGSRGGGGGGRGG